MRFFRRNSATGRFTTAQFVRDNPSTTTTETIHPIPREVGLLLAIADTLIENNHPGSGDLRIVNRSDLKDLERARDLVRAQLQRQARSP